MSNVTWQAQANLNQIIPKQLSDSLTNLNNFLKTADEILQGTESILQIVEVFFTNPFDLLLGILKHLSLGITTVLQDVLGLGGGFIVIHPWNRMNKRFINISTDSKFPMRVPVMNVQEAFNEFYASFANTNDPYRPQWGTNDRATGMGMLIVSPDPSGFLNIIAALQQVIDLKEFRDILNKYSRDIIAWNKDAQKQAGDFANTFAPFDINGITDLQFQSITAINSSGQTTLQSPIIFDRSLPSLHWYGLSISNFLFLNQVTNAIELIINKFISLLQTTDNALKTFFEVLINKLKSLSNLVHVIVTALSSFLISLQSTGLYFFELSTGTGGVQYVISQLQQSLSNPTGDGVILKSHLTDSNFCMLFFMGASVGVDLAAWQALFTSSFDQTNAVAVQLAKVPNINYTISPDFSQVFFFNTPINLSVLSQDSTSVNQLYYTYEIQDQNGTVVTSFLHKIQGGNTLKVNNNSVTLNLSGTGTLTYTITIEVFDFISYSSTYTATFTITDEISFISTIRNGGMLCVTAAKNGKLSLTNKNHPAGGFPIESAYVSAGSTVCLGTSITPFNNSLQLTFDGQDGTSFTVDVTNNLGYRIGDVFGLPIPTSFRFLTFPGKICFQFEGAMKFKPHTSNTWVYITLPSCILITALGCYDYYLYTPATGWSGLQSFCIVQQATEGTQVC